MVLNTNNHTLRVLFLIFLMYTTTCHLKYKLDTKSKSGSHKSELIHHKIGNLIHFGRRTGKIGYEKLNFTLKLLKLAFLVTTTAP